MTDTYEHDLKTSRETIALAIAVAQTGWDGCWDMAWHLAKQDPLLVKTATQTTWTQWAKTQIARETDYQTRARAAGWKFNPALGKWQHPKHKHTGVVKAKYVCEDYL